MASTRGTARRVRWEAGVLVAAGLLAAWPAQSADKPPADAAHQASADSLKRLARALVAYAEGDLAGAPGRTPRPVRRPPPGAGPLRLPPAAAVSPDGKPLYSWRVLILPQLGEKKLYEEFKRNEAWDGPNNKKLLAKMPKVFGPVPGDAQKERKTFYQLFVGPDTAFTGRPPNQGPRFPAAFPDGMANTFLVVEAGEAVPWTAPLDVPYDEKKPVPKLGGLFPDGFQVATAHGEVRYYKKGNPSETTLRAAITPAGGETLGPDF